MLCRHLGFPFARIRDECPALKRYGKVTPYKNLICFIGPFIRILAVLPQLYRLAACAVLNLRYGYALLVSAACNRHRNEIAAFHIRGVNLEPVGISLNSRCLLAVDSPFRR